MGAPRTAVRFTPPIVGAGVTESRTGVFDADVLRDIRSLGLRVFSGDLYSFCASRAAVRGFSIIGCGISSSELSPIFIFCIMGAFEEKPCDWPKTDSGESRRCTGRMVECERMRPSPP